MYLNEGILSYKRLYGYGLCKGNPDAQNSLLRFSTPILRFSSHLWGKVNMLVRAQGHAGKKEIESDTSIHLGYLK